MYRPENFYKPPILTEDETKEILDSLKGEIQNIRVREYIIKPNIKNYNPLETYVIYDKKHILVYNGELHRVRLARGDYESFYISKPDRHV